MSIVVSILRPDAPVERPAEPTAAALEAALRSEASVRISLPLRAITAAPTLGGIRISVKVFDVRPGDGRVRAWTTDAPLDTAQASRLMARVAESGVVPGFLQALLSPE
ncbi:MULTISPECIES: hypothetical protein [unclassified Pseudoclavibacter]|uniref:hypothetical protein n=1 Tax=unclassified Pseudoclavibacter TaxID=2615177 RepID=UPI001BA53AEF|nr:hypothetical protein [Pseudoclavibacter sp. Marseille-Q4354]MBS3180006.1 hypothetical protein [Pseudoclavibacter sp. Marseille-Q4354]